jgi:hypothetical protein
MGGEGSSTHRARCIPTSEVGGLKESAVYINSLRLLENGSKPIATFRSHPSCYTTTELLDDCAVKYEGNSAVGEREILANGARGKYVWLSFPEFRTKCLQFAAALHSIGIGKGDRVGIFSHS